MHLVGFIAKKFVTMHRHTNAKFIMFVFVYFCAMKEDKETGCVDPHNITVGSSWS